MKRLTLLLLSIFLIGLFNTGCKESSSNGGDGSTSIIDETEVVYNWNGDECVVNDVSVTDNRLVVFGGSQANAIAQRMADNLGKNLANFAVDESDIFCQVYAMRNANLNSSDVVLFLVGETDMRLGFEFWKMDDEMMKARNLLDAYQMETIIIGTTMRMVSGYYSVYSPLNQGSALLAFNYREATPDVFDLFRYKIVDLYTLWTPSASFYSDGINLNESGKDALATMINDNY